MKEKHLQLTFSSFGTGDRNISASGVYKLLSHISVRWAIVDTPVSNIVDIASYSQSAPTVAEFGIFVVGYF